MKTQQIRASHHSALRIGVIALAASVALLAGCGDMK